MKPKGHARKRKAKMAQAIFLISVVALFLSPSFLFVAEDFTSGSAFGFTIGESYEAAFAKIDKITDVKIQASENEVWLNYGGLWHINTLRLEFNSDGLSKIEKRRALFELP